MLKFLETLDHAIGRGERWLMVALTAGLTLILCTQVILRYFFNSPLFWAEEVAVQVLIIISFVGVSYLTYSGKLVRVDFLLTMLKPQRSLVLLRVLDIIGLITLGIMCYFATEWIQRPEIRGDVSPTTQIPRWYNYSILVFSFYCMTWHQAVKVLIPENIDMHQLLVKDESTGDGPEVRS
jgi:TRAP-type C4-dicarboxylate transport system permease small subunit